MWDSFRSQQTIDEYENDDFDSAKNQQIGHVRDHMATSLII
jgi:hypothetical protein